MKTKTVLTLALLLTVVSCGKKQSSSGSIDSSSISIQEASIQNARKAYFICSYTSLISQCVRNTSNYRLPLQAFYDHRCFNQYNRCLVNKGLK